MKKPFFPAPDLSPGRSLRPAAVTDQVREIVRAEIQAATRPVSTPPAPPTGLQLAQRAVQVSTDAKIGERRLAAWLFYPHRPTRVAFDLSADHVMLEDEAAPIARAWIKKAIASGAKFSDGNPKPELSSPRTAADLVKEARWMAVEAQLSYWQLSPRELEGTTPPDPDEQVVPRLIRSWCAHDSMIWGIVMPGIDFPVGVVLSDDVLEGGDIGDRLTEAIDTLIRAGM